MARIIDQLAPPGPTPEGHVIVRVGRDDYRKAWAAGIERMLQNLDKDDAPDYRNGLNMPEHIAQPLAVLSEVAVARHLHIPFDWDMAAWVAADHAKYRDRPDVGDNIEVKRVKYLNGRVSVHRKDLGKGRYLFVAYPVPEGEFFNIRILGWMPYDEAWGQGEPAKYNGTTSTTKRVLPVSQLRRCTCIDGVMHGSHTPDGLTAAA